MTRRHAVAHGLIAGQEETMGETARGLVFVSPCRVEIEQLEVAEPGPGDVVVRTTYSGISGGTELLAYRGEVDPDLPKDERLGALGGTFRYPFTYGYSCVGEVVASGRDVQLRSGTRVFAFHPHQDSLVAPANEVLVVPETVPDGVATLYPLVETALQVTLDAGGVYGEPVVLTGLGVVGLLTAVLLTRAGAQVIAAEPQECRRRVADSLGVTAVSPAELPDVVMERTGGRGVPLLVELSGAPQVLADGLDLLGHEGTALVASWYGTKPVTLQLGDAFHRRRLTMRSTQVSTVPAAAAAHWDVARRRATARELLAELPLDALPSTEMPFTDAAEAYARLDRAEPGVLHVALRYD